MLAKCKKIEFNIIQLKMTTLLTLALPRNKMLPPTGISISPRHHFPSFPYDLVSGFHSPSQVSRTICQLIASRMCGAIFNPTGLFPHHTLPLPLLISLTERC